MKNKNRLMSLIISAALFILMLPVTARAADSAFNITGGTENTDYTLSGNTLTIKTSEPLTISGGTADNPITGQIVIQSSTNANLTLNGLNLKGASVDGILSTRATSAIALSDNSTLTLTLAQGSSNTLAGGSGGANSAGAPAINVPEGTTLTVLCSNEADNDHICGENCGSLSATGGSASSSPGGVGIGGATTGGSSGPAGGDSYNSESCGTVLLLGGNIKVDGGTGSSSDSSKAQDIGGADGSSPGTGGTVIILTSVSNSSGSLNVGGGSSGTQNADNGAGIRPSTGDNTYEVYGNLTLPDSLTIPAGVTVNIPSGATLTVPDGKTLTNNGTITGTGTLNIQGDANGDGTVSVTGFTPKTQTSTPSAPSSTSAVTAASVTLTAVTDSSGVGGIQYGYTTGGETSVPDARWQTDTTFNNLSPSTTYTFYARYAGNGFYAPSAASSSGLTVTTSALVDAEAPNITTHPKSGAYTVGTDAALSVAASVSDGGNLSYQWYSNTTNSNAGGTAINGATSENYTPPTSTAGTTYYYCVVTNTNNSATGAKTATAVSNTAEIKVSPAAPTEYTITFDGNGGTSPAAQTTTGKKLTSLPTSTQSGYSFNGWYTAKTGGDKITLDTVFSASVTVYAQWTKNSEGGGDGPGYDYFTITASAGAGGSISPSGSVSVRAGESQSFAITPESGYRISDVLADGRSVGAVSTYTFDSVNAGHTIEAVFAKTNVDGGDTAVPPVISVTTGGTAEVDKSDPNPGDQVTVTVKPDNGYQVKTVTVTDANGVSIAVTDNGDGTYTFTQPESRVTVRAEFEKIPASGESGTVGGNSGGNIPQTGNESQNGGNVPQTDNESRTGGNVPETGDESYVSFWLALMLAAGAGLGGAIIYRRKMC